MRLLLREICGMKRNKTANKESVPLIVSLSSQPTYHHHFSNLTLTPPHFSLISRLLRDTPYVRTTNVQLVDKDPYTISLFWAAINAGDSVDRLLRIWPLL